MNKAATCRHMSFVAKCRHSTGNTYLEVIGWLLERIEQVQAVLPPHTGRAKEDRGDQKQAQAEEAADPLSPAEPDTRDEVVENDRKDDAAERGASGGQRHCQRALLEEVMADDCKSGCEDQSTGHAKEDSLTQDKLVELGAETGEHHGHDQEETTTMGP
jgi:hypothetical protein